MIKVKTKIFAEKEVKEDKKKYMGFFIGKDEYLDIKKLTELLPFSAQTIIKYIKNDLIKGKKIGFKWYVTRENLYKFLK